MRQKTITHSFTLSGRGVHENKPCTLRFHPADKDTGVHFLLNAGGKKNRINAKLDSLCQTSYRLSLGDDNSSIGTVEHLLSAFYGLGISNCFIETTAPEIPVLDGSSRGFVTALMENGIVEQAGFVSIKAIPFPIGLFHGSRYIIAVPDQCLRIDALIKYKHPLLESEFHSYIHDNNLFVSEIASARTFGFLSEWSKLKAQGYALGSQPENTVIFDKNALVNPPLRYDNECVRHKILDFMSALSLLDYGIIGRFYLHQPGHSVDAAFVTLLDSLIDFSEPPIDLSPGQCFDPLKLNAVLHRDFGNTSL